MALEAGEVPAAVDGILRLYAESLDEADHEVVRRLIAVLGERAANAPVDVESIVRPYLELLLELRTNARVDKRFADSDLIRDRLTAAGVEIRDTPDGPEWALT